MFQIGDRVVYPMHGAGVIQAIEEREVLGNRKEYYILKLPYGDMQVMIPIDNVDDLGIRSVISPDRIATVLQVLRGKDQPLPANWNRRYRANLEKIRTGDVFEVAEVVRALVHRDREKGLSTGERRMLDSAQQILLSELSLADGMEEGTASRLLTEALA